MQTDNLEVDGLKGDSVEDRQQLLLRIAGGVLTLVFSIVLLAGVQLLWTTFHHSSSANSEQDYSLRINLEDATVAELMLIPGFGEVLAVRWLEQREELMQQYPDALTAFSHMQGIGKSKLDAIRPYIVDETANSGQANGLARSHEPSAQP